MNIEKIKAGKPIWVRGYADGVGNIDFLDRERNIDELECLIKDDIFYMSESDFRLDEPEIIDKFEVDQPKPAVPQCVLDFVDNSRELDYEFEEWFYYSNQPLEVYEWLNPENKRQAELNALALVTLIVNGPDAVTVKKEKLYTVEIPDPNSEDTVYYLFKNEDGQVEIGSVLFLETEPDDSWRDDPDMQLTEQEIKKDFEWALKWKKEVI